MSTDSWIATASGDWFTASNWSEKHSPLAGEDVVIDPASPVTVTFNGLAADVNSLTVGADTFDMASGALAIAGAATFGGALDVEGGTLTFADASTNLANFDQTGGTVVVRTGILAVGGANVDLGGAIDGVGELDVDGNATLVAGASLKVGRLEIDGAGTVLTDNVAAAQAYHGDLYLDGATFDLGGGSLLVTGATESHDGVVDGSGVVATSGKDTLSGVAFGGTVNFQVNSTATQSGDDDVVGDASGDAATLTITADGVYGIDDDTGIERGAGSGSIIENRGTFGKIGGSGFSVISVDVHDTGTIENSVGGSDLEFDGARNYLSGVYTGPGMIDYGPDGVSTLGDIEITESACGANYGVVNVVGVVTFHDGSTMVNDSGAHWNFDGDVGLACATPGSTSPLITNYGVMSKIAGAGTSAVEIDTTDASGGSVVVDTGTLALDGASNQVAGGVAGKGVFEFGGGDATIEAGAKFTVASLSVSDDNTQVTVDADVGYAGAFSLGAGATVDLSGGYLSLSGAASFAGGTVDGGSTLFTSGASDISGLTIGGTAKWVNSGAVTQDGGDVTIGDSTGAIASLNNAASGVYDITDDSGVGIGTSTASSIVNTGTIEKTGGTGTSVIAPNILNNGTGVLLADSGVLDIAGALVGTGEGEVGAGATLELGGAVGPSQTLAYSGSGGEIWLDDLQASGEQIFHGQISGFGTADMIDIGAATLVGFKEKAGNASGVLTLNDGGATAAITMLGDYATGNFAPSVVDGRNVLTYSPLSFAAGT